MEDMHEFRKECDEWLNPLGYTVHYTSVGGRHLTYTNNDGKGPAIICVWKVNGEKRCIVSDNASFKLFLTLTSGEIQFKHPDIKRYISIFDFYCSMAERYPPF